MARLGVIALAAFLAFSAATAHADVITSTVAGGAWFSSGTWVGGAVPTSDDDVVIVGPVTIAGVALCRNVQVAPAGSVNGAVVAPPRTLRASGAISNAGSIGTVNPIYLDVEVGGDLYNAGTWTPVRTRLIGPGARNLSHAPGHGLSTDLAYAAGASGDLVATSPLSLSGAADMTAGRLVLAPDCPLTLDAASFRGNLQANGNELRFVSWSYLQNCSIDDVTLVGAAEAAWGVVVTTRLRVMDSLENSTHSGGGSVIVEGDLENYGLIRNLQYSFPVYVSGDVENHGNIDCPQFLLTGVGVVHNLIMGPEGIINAPLILPEFEAATVVAETPVRFGDGLGLGVGTLVLAPGSSLEFVSYGAIGSGTIQAGGNEISVQGSGSISNTTIVQGVFGDRVVIYGENLCTGGLTVRGTVESWPWAAADLTVEGTLRNEGQIADGAHPVRIRALGDLENLGTFTNARIVLAGAADQTVGAGSEGIDVPEFVIESGLTGGGYQWYRDGVALPGEHGANLTLAGVASDDDGVYHCTSQGQVSRNVILAETTGSSGAATVAGAVTLLQNHPNPFAHTTRIAFQLREAAPTTLRIYDPAGREVAHLVEGNLSAGRHEIPWDAGRLPAGLYAYRLQVGGSTRVGKCTLLR